jgi:hypothetical protein
VVTIKVVGLLLGVARQARKRGLRPGDRRIREMLWLAGTWVDEGMAPARASRDAAMMVCREYLQPRSRALR